ncbi:anhydro-N-acetylmuramic acid kinase [Plantibacter sp. MMLR14_011]|uniref:anhydro-N-acetylmuramic acid kinase n=1 Tax=Plantibacter sp. MMLR14_011 TaxID=1898746 RepID=UPI0020C87B93|nr:anhydro-N-acetylmuramic acid kinase [Plantibacter sp. MMLR14_011]
MSRPMRVIGLMSGTSHDAIDAAAAEIGVDGDTLVVRPLGMITAGYDPELRAAITAALPPATTSVDDVCRLDTRIGQAFADLAVRAVAELCDGEADLIVSHGQTMYHWVEDGRVEGTLQLGQPAWIAERTGCTVVADLRSRDVAAGGQGAPLVSMVDALWLGGETAAAVNLGGIANATIVRPGHDPIAFDSGPANALIDAVVAEHTGGARQFDADGELAARGTVHEETLDLLLREPYYQRPAPKSTGKELFHLDYLREQLAGRPTLPIEDLVATLTELTARTVADAVRGVERVILAGGGVRNPQLVARIRAALPEADVVSSDDAGLPSDAKEALAFAVLGFLTVNGQAGSLPSATGASHGSVLGAIVPGHSLPARTLDGPPRALRFEA